MIADQLEALSQKAEQPEVKQPLDHLEDAASRIGKAWSGSCIGYHSRIYYKGLKPTPPGALVDRGLQPEDGRGRHL